LIRLYKLLKIRLNVNELSFELPKAAKIDILSSTEYLSVLLWFIIDENIVADNPLMSP